MGALSRFFPRLSGLFFRRRNDFPGLFLTRIKSLIEHPAPGERKSLARPGFGPMGNRPGSECPFESMVYLFLCCTGLRFK